VPGERRRRQRHPLLGSGHGERGARHHRRVPWTTISQRGLAHRPDDDTFYIGGWNQGILYHIKGLSWDVPGQVLGQCSPPDGSISGLAWNPSVGSVWEATNSPSDAIYRLDPDTCAVLGTLAHPQPGFDGAGLEMDEAENLWMIDQEPNTVYLIDSGGPARRAPDPSARDPPLRRDRGGEPRAAGPRHHIRGGEPERGRPRVSRRGERRPAEHPLRARRGYAAPIVNAIRVIHRPDR
jgi:hypothetical protein